MRSPPADIFVYGVHPDTSTEDIVLDLADSGIIIQEKDITNKSREDAHLQCYKISIKAEDLSKALDPAVWPMRVKVREFIHYSKKNARANANSGSNQSGTGSGDRHWAGNGNGGGPPAGPGAHVGGVGHPGPAASHGAHVGVVGQPGYEEQAFLAPNRYALHDDNVPGGPRIV